jgi:hypothetical protein
VTVPKIYKSTVINAPADRVWAKVRDYNGLPSWHPRLAESHIERGEPADKIGCIRALRLADGGTVREQLLALSDYEFFYTYAILESQMGVENYVATLKLIPVTDGDRTFAEWSADFECAAGRERELVEGIGTNVFAGGLDALKQQLGR